MCDREIEIEMACIFATRAHEPQKSEDDKIEIKIKHACGRDPEPYQKGTIYM